ncbi:hypothetical protein ACFHWW_09530, partial [Ensifer sp. P24N7]|uniref:hypothetical protein n=1 Tax=Sinorhizobium sp. P24N7 TaxID=3348358 RepID=UPI0035F3625C
TKTFKAQSRQSASANLGNPRAKDIVASSAAALVSDRAYRPPPSDTSTGFFKKNDSFLTKPDKAGFCRAQILFGARPSGCGYIISPLLLHNRPI